jgi:hypothetical protein
MACCLLRSKTMTNLTTVATIIAFGLGLGACTQETYTSALDASGGEGGATFESTAQTLAAGGSSVVGTTVVTTVVQTVTKLSACVPGAQSACTCTDGASGAQTCGDDGKLAGCVCQPAVVAAPVTVAPDGYSGKCLMIGASTGTDGACPTERPYLQINCPANPPAAAGCAMLTSGMILGGNPIGMRCCKTSLL